MFIAPPSGRGPRIGPVAFSMGVHAVLLALVATGSAVRTRSPRNRYEEVFAPNERKLVWYRFKDKLPEIAPPDGPPDAPRADRIAPQTIRSKQDAPPSSQRVWVPGPAPTLTADLPAPNLLAIAQPKTPPKLVTPPDIVKPPEPEPIPPPPPRPRRKRFQPPAEVARRGATPDLPDAPIAREELPEDPFRAPKLAPKPYTPPEAPKTAAAPVAPLPDAPSTPAVSDLSRQAALNLPAARLAPRKYTPPTARPAAPSSRSVTLPAAPDAAASAVIPGAPSPLGGPALPGKPRPRSYQAPAPTTATAAPAPSLDELPVVPGGNAANISAAIVGVNPVNTPVPVIPRGSKPADIAAGPEINRTTDGAGGAPNATAAPIPGLIVRGGIGAKTTPLPPASAANQIASVMNAAPTSRETLAASIRPPAPPPTAPGISAPTRQPSTDFAFNGRIVYSMVIQMPNVTSFSGSWMMWFAERNPKPGPLNPPGAIRKVDPVYPRAAVEEKRQGRVRVAAILGPDGRFGEVLVVKGVDPRIDAAAVAALRKWEFEPARRAGTPVEVDAIIEIPFLLTPLSNP